MGTPLHLFLSAMAPARSVVFICSILLAVLCVCDACKITVKIRSQTKEKFRIQIFVPSVKQKSEKVLFTGPEEKKLQYPDHFVFLVQIEGENCLEEKWVIRTWKPDGAGDWAGAKQESAKIDGQGYFRIIVGDDLRPQMSDRTGIFCSEGPFCG